MTHFHKTLFRDVILAAGIIGLLGFVSYASNKENLHNYTTSKSQYINTNQLLDCTSSKILESFTPIVHIPCDVLFNIHKFGICMDIPDYYYNLYPVCYDKIKIYFNLRPEINYTNIGTCHYEDIQLTITKMDYNRLTMFWLIY